MKILSPADHIEEVKPLLKAGADELYSGFVPPEWRDKYGFLGSINKRTFLEAQFDKESDLTEAVEATHSLGGRFFLTLNNDYYSLEQYPLLLKEVERAIKLGIDALLVADLGLILEIRKRNFPINLHLSILTAVMNSEAARFYKELGLKRVVLERTLTVDEIGQIIRNVDGLEFEVFIAYGKCPNIEGLCTLFHHDDPKHRWPCGWEYKLAQSSELRAQSESCLRTTNYEQRTISVQNMWAKTARGDACGLCAMYDLNEAGITSLKIAGRGRYTEHKLRAVKMVVKMRNLIKEGMAKEGFYKAALENYQEMFGKECNPYVCYCPELKLSSPLMGEDQGGGE